MREASSSHSGVINTTCVFAPISAKFWTAGCRPGRPRRPVGPPSPLVTPPSGPSPATDRAELPRPHDRSCVPFPADPARRPDPSPADGGTGWRDRDRSGSEARKRAVRTQRGRPGDSRRTARRRFGRRVDSERDRVGFGRVRGSIRRGSMHPRTTTTSASRSVRNVIEVSSPSARIVASRSGSRGPRAGTPRRSGTRSPRPVVSDQRADGDRSGRVAGRSGSPLRTRRNWPQW